MTGELELRLLTAIAVLGRCVVCGRAPAGSAALYIPDDRPHRGAVYSLCRRCHSGPGWEQRAEDVIYARWPA